MKGSGAVEVPEPFVLALVDKKKNKAAQNHSDSVFTNVLT